MADVPVNFTGKVRGWNLTSKPGHPDELEYIVEWDWDGWIRKQVDYAMAMGANCIRLIGSVTAVSTAAITQGQYNARIQQFAAYCVANNLGFYYTGCASIKTDGADNGTLSLYSVDSGATLAAIINSNIGSITGVSGAPDYSANIIGCDIVQEANNGWTAAKVNNLYSLIKPNVKAPIGCTFSTFGVMPDSSWINSIINSCDYLDYHCYPQVYGVGSIPTPTTVTNGPRTSYPTKEIIFGEVGARQSYTTQQITDWIAGTAAIGEMADANVRGRGDWAVQDQSSSDTTLQYGAFNGAWVPRSEIVIPTIRGLGGAGGTPAAPTNVRVVNDALTWDPTGCSSAFDSTKLYRNGTQIANPIHCRYDDSANWIASKQYVYQASAIAGASEGAKVQYVHPGRLPRRALRRRAQATFR